MSPQTLAEAKLLFVLVKKSIKNIKDVEVVICPPFVYLSKLQLTTDNLRLGAQDCFWENSGAFTGEISPLMLKNLGVEYVILGHSERRRYLKEADEMINKKIKAVLKAKLKPILCIGETEKQRKAKKTEEILKNQLKNLSDSNSPITLSGLWQKEEATSLGSLRKVIVAYEPVWAIGTGRACRISEAKETNLFIRKIVKDVPILYGGSVNSKNAKDYILKAGFDGLLVGSTSLDAKEFIKLVKKVSPTFL